MAVRITGLSSDLYYINNPIMVYLSNTLTFTRITVKIGDFAPISLTPIADGLGNSAVTINLSPYLKGMFPVLRQDNNLLNVPIVVTYFNRVALAGEVQIGTTTIVRDFVRGGIRTNQTNVNAQMNQVLSPTEYIPMWGGYPAVKSQIIIQDNIKSIAHTELIENEPLSQRMKIKGCNPTYVKFLNSLGGYSSWLFEGVTDKQQNSNQGIINNIITSDLGNELNREIEVYSKVPKRYVPLMQDLIISPEIYIYKITGNGVVWERYLSQNNTIEHNPAKNAQEVKIKLKPFERFNPQTLWQ